MARFNFFIMLTIAASMLYTGTAAPDHYVSTRAAYYQTPDGLGTPSGACGIGEYGRKINHARVAAVSGRLYKDGIGCGFCYQVRCKDPKYCSKKGTEVMVTDSGEGDNTDFILSHKAYTQLGRGKAAARHLLAAGVVEVEFRRVRCQLPRTHHSDIFFRFDKKHSNLPNYVAVLVLYLGGHGSVQGVSMYTQEGNDTRRVEITPMRRAYGAIWDLAHPNIEPNLIFNISKANGFQNLQIQADFSSTANTETAIHST